MVGEVWKEETVVTAVNQWVYEGGTFIGVDEPSATEGYDCFFRMAQVLGVDKDNGARVCHGKWQFKVEEIPGLLPEGCTFPEREDRFLTDGTARVLRAHNGNPDLTIHDFGKGHGIYLGGFSYTLENTRMLLNLILFGAGETLDQEYITSNPYTECAYYPEIQRLVVINNSEECQTASVKTDQGVLSFSIDPYDQKSVNI